VVLSQTQLNVCLYPLQTEEQKQMVVRKKAVWGSQSALGMGQVFVLDQAMSDQGRGA